jgi:hypothetical protein
MAGHRSDLPEPGRCRTFESRQDPLCPSQERQAGKQHHTGRAEAELQSAQDEMEQLTRTDAEFAKVIAGHPISYELVDDLGKGGSVLLATWTDAGFEYRQKLGK